MNIRKIKSNGFTLVEMLVVVTLIAIVASIIIALLGGASKDAAEIVNESNVRHLTSQIGSYQQLHGGLLPDKLDSLLDSNKVESVSYTLLATGVSVVDNPGTVFYCGKDLDNDGVVDDPSSTSKGINPKAWSGTFASLTVTQLTTNDINQLTELGITTVKDLYTTTGDLFNGMERYTERRLKVGDPVATVDPYTVKNGRLIYRDLGFHEISDETKYPKNGETYITDEARSNAMKAFRLLVFGVGPECTLVGDRKAGVQEAPRSLAVGAGYYNRYLVVIKVNVDSRTDVDADFIGVLDPQGNSSRSANSWATRTGN